MPNLQNASKALRQAKKRALLNVAKKTAIRDGFKKTLKAVTKSEAMIAVRLAQKALGKAIKHGTIKKNTAARKLSRLMKKVNALK